VSANKGNTNLTKKGTKQRSFNLDDATFAIVEAEAARLHITNSAALSMILNDWADEGPVTRPTLTQEQAAEQHVAEASSARPPSTSAPREPMTPLPDPAATSFNVVDPDNDAQAAGRQRRVTHSRAKEDTRLSNGGEVKRSRHVEGEMDLGDE
jgi:hypothetical protein